jgi:hypothetical protein
MAQDGSRTMLQLCAPPTLTAAVKLAASREMMTLSEYVRRVLIDRLRSDGIDPTVPASVQRPPRETGIAA